MNRKLTFSLVSTLLLSAALSACGGGGGDDGLDFLKSVNIERATMECSGSVDKADHSCTVGEGTDDFDITAKVLVTGMKFDDVKLTWKPGVGDTSQQTLSLGNNRRDGDKFSETQTFHSDQPRVAGDTFKIEVHVEGREGKSGDVTFTVKVK
ncbi:MAG: hypothetical protein REI09_02955 [Candidatus Dactylopiibacterium sp.]|nr:hypothetical protein [Candidatus Dactylopiibacterium sp.]